MMGIMNGMGICSHICTQIFFRNVMGKFCILSTNVLILCCFIWRIIPSYDLMHHLEEKMIWSNLHRITFLTVLTACSYAGLVKKGCEYFKLMNDYYGIIPSEDHYARLIDLLGRAGKLSEAKGIIEKMPFKAGAPVWEALLAGCRIHGNFAESPMCRNCLLKAHV